MTMKNLFSCPSLFAGLLLGLVSTNALPASDRSREPDARKTQGGEISPSAGTVRVDNHFGPVTVTGVDSGFGWNWELRNWAGSPAEAEAYLNRCQLEVHETAGTLDLRLVLPDEKPPESKHTSGWSKLVAFLTGDWHFDSFNRNLDSTLQLRVPRGVTLDLKNRFGPVAASATRGALNVDAEFGNVDLADLAGAVSARTTFAKLHAERIGPANLRSQNGDLEARCVAGDLTASTSFARLRVQDVKGRAELKNQNGSIETSGVTGDLVATTSFANLKARDISGRADLKNQNGSIDAAALTGDLLATTSFAELKAHDIGGSADLKSQNGRIEAANIGGDLTAATSFAALHVQDVRGKANLTGQNGEIAATGVTGDIRAKTSFARLQLDGTGRRFDARNQNGAVEITARSPQVAQIDASTSFDRVEVRLPASSKPLIRANTSFGKVHSDFPVMLGDTLPDAKFGDDTTPLKVTLHGQNGDIRILRLAGQE